MEDLKNAYIADIGHSDQEDKPGTSRTWLLLLYPDSDESGSHKNALEKLDELDWNYCGRVHDQDEGVKPHHHVLICFPAGRSKEAVANDLGIDTRWIRRVHSQKKAMRYLCHKDNRNKFQYSPSEIYGTLADKAIAQCSKGDLLSEVEGTNKVIQIIQEWPGIIEFDQLLCSVLAEGVYPHYRRLGNTVFRMVDRHNQICYELGLNKHEK